MRTLFWIGCVLLLLSVSSLVCSGTVFAASSAAASGAADSKAGLQYRNDEILVKFRPDVSDEAKISLHRKHGAQKKKDFQKLRIHVLKLKKGMSVEDAVKLYRDHPGVEYAEPNYVIVPANVPDDPQYYQQWALEKIQAAEAWDFTTGSADIVVAVLDSGIDVNHEDLAANLWVNPGEIPANGIDDDGNGYVDDVHGVNTIAGSGDLAEEIIHGTNSAGIIGAVGDNGTGVSGINWNVKILSCKFMDSTNGDLATAIECLEYVRAMKNRGVTIVATNNSWLQAGNNDHYSQSVYDAINAQRDILFIAAAANENTDNDIRPYYPSNYYLPNVISVTATDSFDNQVWNYGRRTVHVGAPGYGILTTDPGNAYKSALGTSVAAPHVAGIAALIKAQDMNRDWIAIKNLILSGGDTISSLTGKTATGKRINAYGSLTCVDKPVLSMLTSPAYVQIGTPSVFSALSINCAVPVGPVYITTPANETIELLDDGIAPDLAAGDGIFSGTWTPSGIVESVTVSSTAGTETVPVYVNTQPWARTYDSGGNDQATGVVVDDAENVYVAGSTQTLKYDSSGNVLWSKDMPGNAITIYQNNQIFVTGSGGTVKYDPAGNINWSDTIAGMDLAVDGSGNLYVMAASETRKYDPLGNVIWTKPLFTGTPSSGGDIAVDSTGNIYIAQHTNGTPPLIIKYNANGDFIWSTYFKAGSYDGKYDSINDIAVDKSDNVIIAGSSYSSAYYGYKSISAKFGPLGNELWRRAYNSGRKETLDGVFVDKYNNVYVTGQLYGTTPEDVLVVIYDSAGNTLRVLTHDEGGSEIGRSLALDTHGNLYIAGAKYASTAWDYLLVKYFLNVGIATSTLAPGSAAVPYQGKLVSFGGVEPFVWSVISGTLPDGLNLDSMGTVSGTPTATGTFTFTARVTDAGNVTASKEYTIAIYDPIIISPSELPLGAVGEPYNETVSATAGVAPYTWSIVSGALPDGLALNGSTGVISGTPTIPGNCDFTLQVKDSRQLANTKAYTITVSDIRILTSSPLPVCSVGLFCSQTLAASGGTLPYLWSVYSGMLPAGLSLDSSTGTISGTPVAVETSGFTIQVADAVNSLMRKQFSLSIYTPLIISPASPPTGTAGTRYAYGLSATGGKTPYTWSVANGSLPAGLSITDTTGEIYGPPAEAGTFDFTVRVTDANNTASEISLSLTIDPDTIAPTTAAYPGGGSYAAAQTVVLQADEAATIYCTTDGSLPVAPGSVCPVAINVNRSLTLKYFAVDALGHQEDVKTETYTISGGEVWGWGNNNFKQLGDQSNGLISAIAGLTDMIAARAGLYNTIALKSDGTVWILGKSNGQIHPSPVQVNVTNIAAISAGSLHSAAVRDDGTVRTWGENTFGQLGDGTANPNPNIVAVSGLNDVAAIAAGGLFTLALKYDGTVWAWGDNHLGSLGDGTINNRYTPGQVTGLNDVVAIAAGTAHSLALRSDGTVWAWGLNDAGQLGDGTTNNRYAPVQVSGVHDVVAVGTGSFHSMAVKSDGTVWGWGANYHGQLGGGAGNSSSLPLNVSPLSDIFSVACSQYNSMGIANNGTIWLWGGGSTGPVQVPEIFGADALSAGNSHTVAVKPYPLTVETMSLPYGITSSSYSYGIAAIGGLPPYTWTLDLGSLPPGLMLDQASGLLSGTPTAAGTYNFIVKATDSKGISATEQFSIEVFDPLSITTTALYVPVDTPYDTYLAANGGKTPYSWSITGGSLPAGLSLNSAGELSGLPTNPGTFSFTAQVTDANGWTAAGSVSIYVLEPLMISTLVLPDGLAGTSYSQPLAATGGLPSYTWSIFSGALPTGLNIDAASGILSGIPMEAGIFNITVTATDSLSASAAQTFSLTINPDLTAPVTAAYPPGGPYNGSRAVHLTPDESAVTYCTTDGSVPAIPDSVCASVIHITGSVVLKFFSVDSFGNQEDVKTESYTITSADLWASGNNTSGALGDGSTTSTLTPVPITGMDDALAIANGSYHSIALKKDGTVWTWGASFYGQLGREGSALDPAPVNGLDDVVAVAAGNRHTVALKRDGTVWAWGTGGTIGDGTTAERRAPVPVSGLTGVAAIAAGPLGSFTAALKTDGTVWAWGSNTYGQLGDGTKDQRLTPVQVTGLADVVAISAGRLHSLALRKDGTVWAWGMNYYGQLGDGTALDRLTAVRVGGLSDVVAVAAGGSYSNALKQDGTVWTWGGNRYGQLGNGSTIERTLPGPAGGLGEVIAISAGEYHTTAVKSDGTAWAWGHNASGEFGNGTTADSAVPLRVDGFSGSAILVAGYSRTFALKMAPLALMTPSLPDAYKYVAYTKQLEASGGLAPYAWSIASGNLAAGLTLNSATGEISGVPTTAGISSLTLAVTDTSGTTASIELSLTTYDPVVITSAQLPFAVTGNQYTCNLLASGGKAPFSWTVPSGSLPTGLTLDDATGIISGVPTAIGQFSFTVQVMDANGMKNTKAMNAEVFEPLVITTTTFSVAQKHEPYSETLAATGGKTPFTWTLSEGKLPGGLSLDSTTGEISGVAEERETFSFTVMVQDSNSSVNTKAYAITVE